MRHSGSIGVVTLVLAWAIPLLAQAPPTPVPGVQFGAPFPAAELENLNPGAGGPTVDLARVLGKRPAVFYYWLAGNPQADSTFTEVQALADELGPTNLALYGVVTERPGLGREDIQLRIRELKIHVPVLNDVGFRIGQQLGVRQVPSISIVDSEGRLRLANAGSLRQPLEYKLDVRGIIERAGAGAAVGTYGQMPKWYPVKELVGQRCPDFEAPALDNGEIRRWSSMIEPGKIGVLMFWSVECPHCRKALPELNQWLKTKANAEGLNVVGAARVNDEAERIKTQEFCNGNGFIFPTLVDRNLDITDRFGVVSTPTFVIVGPDGVIDSVVLSGEGELPDKLEAKKKELLRPASSGT